MAFTPNYTSADVAPVLIDSGTKVLVQIGVFASIIGMILTGVIAVALYKKLK